MTTPALPASGSEDWYEWATWVHEQASAPEPTASDIAFTPTGTIAATTVQGAIAEAASEAGGGGATDLDDLTDVDLTGQADGDFLSRVGGVWVPVDPPSGGGGSGGSTSVSVTKKWDGTKAGNYSIPAYTSAFAVPSWLPKVLFASTDTPVVGDVLAVDMAMFLDNTAGDVYWDLAIVNPTTNAVIRRLMPGAYGHMYNNSGYFGIELSGAIVLEAADIVSGEVAVAAVFRTETSARTILNTANYGPRVSAILIRKEVNAGAVPEDTAWVALTLTSGTSGASGSYHGPGYKKTGLGEVRLRGLINMGTNNASHFTLPAGFRPEKNVLMFAPGGGASTTPVYVLVQANGQVLLGASSSQNTVSLDAVRFEAYA